MSPKTIAKCSQMDFCFLCAIVNVKSLKKCYERKKNRKGLDTMYCFTIHLCKIKGVLT